MEIRLTDREAELMDVLWQHGPSTVAEVQDRLADSPAYTTVLTILRTLERKGYAGHSEEGRAHRYSAAVERDVARRSALKALSRKLFEGSTELLLTHLVSNEKLDDAQIRRIKRLLDKRSRRKET
ncbi:MAG TPA: BlaI/MecI/CopY family transcriptional regulator [Gammaproteobacteria bacterium]|nr:BlaI/MecI/CopY family transcriptional regulator [Gammaproteobacteria bacterium]